MTGVEAMKKPKVTVRSVEHLSDEEKLTLLLGGDVGISESLAPSLSQAYAEIRQLAEAWALKAADYGSSSAEAAAAKAAFTRALAALSDHINNLNRLRSQMSDVNELLAILDGGPLHYNAAVDHTYKAAASVIRSLSAPLVPPSERVALLDWLKSLESCIRYGTKLNESDLPAVEQVRTIIAASVSAPPGWVDAMEQCAKVAEADAAIYRERLVRAKKRYANRELLAAVGSTADPDAECIDLEASLGTAEGIANTIRAMIASAAGGTGREG
jgi:hypothetical protein